MTTHPEFWSFPEAEHVPLVFLVACLFIEISLVACSSVRGLYVFFIFQGWSHLEHLSVLCILFLAQHGCWVSVSSVVNTCECKKTDFVLPARLQRWGTCSFKEAGCGRLACLLTWAGKGGWREQVLAIRPPSCPAAFACQGRPPTDDLEKGMGWLELSVCAVEWTRPVGMN